MWPECDEHGRATTVNGLLHILPLNLDQYVTSIMNQYDDVLL